MAYLKTATESLERMIKTYKLIVYNLSVYSFFRIGLN